MMKKTTLIMLSLVSLSLAGCSMMGIDNRSLEYKNAKTLKPLEVPYGMQMREETALYPSPVIEEHALNNAPRYENRRGNRYELPRPALGASMSMNTIQLQNLRPHMIYDGNKNPLLQIAGDTEQIWRYVVATASSLNYKLTSEDKTSVVLEKDGKQYLLYLSQIGATHVLALYDETGSFASKEIATEILTQIYQNWPV